MCTNPFPRPVFRLHMYQRVVSLTNLQFCNIFRIQFTGSQESILQLDLDTEEGEAMPSEDMHRGRNVSPTFVIQLDHEVRYFRSFYEDNYIRF